MPIMCAYVQQTRMGEVAVDVGAMALGDTAKILHFDRLTKLFGQKLGKRSQGFIFELPWLQLADSEQAYT